MYLQASAARHDPALLAQLAMAVQTKLYTQAAGLDPAHQATLLHDMPWLRAGAPAQVSNPRWASAVAPLWGGLPPLEALIEPLGRLALLGRGRVLASLCMLALARRPGVLRGMVERSTKDGLRNLLGASWTGLYAVGTKSSGAAIACELKDPVQWALVGYEDWKEAVGTRSEPLHRMVWWSLPPDAVAKGLPCTAPKPLHPCAAALDNLSKEGLAWPC
jgi:Bacterial type III secretion protein (HrpB4)